MLWPLLNFLILSCIACCLPYAVPAIQSPFLFPKYVKLTPALGPLHVLHDVLCVWVWKLDSKKGWAPKNWCLQTMVLEKILESSLDCKEIKSVSPKGNQPWVFSGRTDAETPVLWPPDGKSRLTGKDPDAGKDWRQEEKGTTEEEMVGWCHWLHGHEFEQTPGNSEGQGNLASSSPWGCKESDMTELLNNKGVNWQSG